MDKGGYGSLFKSFNKAQGSKGPTNSEQKVIAKPVTTRTSINEILREPTNQEPPPRQSTATARKSVQEILKGSTRQDQSLASYPVTSPKSVDEILSGRAVSGVGGRQFGDVPESVRSRKSIDHIIAGAKNSVLPVPNQNRHAVTPDPISKKPVAEILSKSSAIKPLQQAQTTERADDGTVQKSNVTTHAPLIRSNSQKLIFDFSAPSTPPPTKPVS